ncbi:Single-stranded DNA-binding protein [bioreactor metagenome]|uniref:Single-stranded DNA-binding protein n=1 Tax=bioreactor metagenome TaxID=1076179 RepID=A0A644WVK8_9ZZZZ
MELQFENSNDEKARMLVLTGEEEPKKKRNPEKNLVFLEGIVASEPFPKQFSNGNKLVVFTLTFCNNYRTRGGEQIRISEWFQVVSWNKVADVVMNTVHKGARVKLKGRLRSSAWKDQEGVSHRRVQIVATEMKQAA